MADSKEQLSTGTRITGTDGNDRIRGTEGHDHLDGGAGNDRIRAEGGRDILYGGAGNDKLDGGQNSDKIYGGEGNDILIGQGGSDVMVGGDGSDYLKGGAGDDIFVVDLRPAGLSDGPDTIADFKAGQDKLAFHSEEEGDQTSFENNGDNLEIYVFHHEEKLLSTILLDMSRETLFSHNFLESVDIV